VLFGGIEKSDLDINSSSSIVIVVGTLFITIILLNILIAYLSNLFSRLEQEQKKKKLQGQADIILDTEVLIYCFKKIFYRNKSQQVFQRFMLTNIIYADSCIINSKTKTKRIVFIKNKDKNNGFFEPDSDSLAEEVQGKLNILEARLDKLDITTMEIKDLLRLNAQSQKNQIDAMTELRKLVLKNINNLQANL
jgi:hypothetical protein